MRKSIALLLASGVLLAATAGWCADPEWKQGEQYFLINPPQPKINAANKIEVTEAFSYGCPACFQFYPLMDKLKASLPADVKIEYLPASFIPAESWPLFQRAFCTAQALGLVEKSHAQMFDAIWKTGELATMDPTTHRLKESPPRIENVAKFYSHTTGVDEQKFVAAARSFGVDNCVQQADRMMEAYRVDSTPSLIVNGKYRTSPASAGSYGQMVDLVKWLVAKEKAGH